MLALSLQSSSSILSCPGITGTYHQALQNQLNLKAYFQDKLQESNFLKNLFWQNSFFLFFFAHSAGCVHCMRAAGYLI